MLQAIRSRAGGIVVKGLFALLIISFGFWGVYTNSPENEKSPSTVIATVGEQTIRAEDLRAILEPTLQRLRTQLGTTIEKQQIKQFGIVDTLMGQLVDRSLLDQEAARLVLEVSDDVIRGAITANPAFRGADGRFDRNLFNQVLAMNRLSEDQLVARLRHDIPRTDILHAITAGVTAPRVVVDTLHRYRDERRIAEIVALPLSGAGDVGQPDDSDLAKFYETHPDLFRAPEYRGFRMASLSASDVEPGVEITDARLKREYDDRKDDFATPEQREVQQILSPSEDKAKEVEAVLAAGKDWREVATTIAGQDPTTIDLGLMKREEMPRVLADIAFELQLDQPSQPVKTPLGWHILRVVKIQPPANQSFAEVKPKLAADLAHEEAVDRLDKLGHKVDDALAGGMSLAEAAAKFGLKTTVVEATDIGGRNPDGNPVVLPVAAAEVLRLVFETNQTELSRVVSVEEGAIFVIYTDKVTPPRVKPLAEVKSKAVAAWQADRKRDAMTKQAEAIAASVKPDMPLAKVAGDRKLTATVSPPLLRRSDPANGVTPALIAKLFAAKTGDIVTAEDTNGAYVAVLKEIKPPEALTDAQAAQLSKELSGTVKLDVATEFTEALRNRFPVKLERQAIEQAY